MTSASDFEPSGKSGRQNLVTDSRRVLAARTEFVLSSEAQAAWEEINARPARDLPGLCKLMQRPSPFKP